MQGTSQSLGSTEKHTRLSRRVQLPDASENHIPVRTAKVGRAPQARNGILVGVCVVDHDVCGIVRLDLGRQVRVNLDAVVHVLRLDGQQQRAEPLKRPKVSADPEEVDLAQARLLLRVVHAVPDGLEDGGERGDSYTGADENGHLVLEDVLGGRSEGPVDVDSGQDALQGRVGVFVAGNANDLARAALLVPLAAQNGRDLLCEITHATHVDGDVVLLGGARQGERVVLPERHGRAAEENVLSGSRLGVLLLDLDLAHVAGVLDDL